MSEIANCTICGISYLHTEDENILLNEKFIKRGKNYFSIYYVYTGKNKVAGENICIDCLIKGLSNNTIKEVKGDFYFTNKTTLDILNDIVKDLTNNNPLDELDVNNLKWIIENLQKGETEAKSIDEEYLVRVVIEGEQPKIYKTNYTRYEIEKLKESYMLLVNNCVYSGEFSEYIRLLELQEKYCAVFIEFYKNDESIETV